jgi:hypothetical protein
VAPVAAARRVPAPWIFLDPRPLSHQIQRMISLLGPSTLGSRIQRTTFPSDPPPLGSLIQEGGGSQGACFLAAES